MHGVIKAISVLGVATLLIGGMFVASASAMQFSSSDFVIDAATLNNVGGFSSSGNYQLTSSGGEAAIGNGASGSYKMAAGYVAQIIKPQITVQTQPSGLVAYYPLDEGSGTVAHDNSANSLNGDIHSGVWTTGKIGNAVNFVGSNDSVIDLGNPTAMQSTTLTIQAWVRTIYTADGMSIVAKQNAWKLGVAVDTGKYAAIDNGTDAGCVGTTDIIDGNWHQVAVTIQSGVTSGTKLYVDGSLEATCKVTMNSQSNNALIGAYDGWNNYSYTGNIDQVKIFNRVLSADELKAEYSAQNSGVPTGLTLQTIVPGASNTSSFDTIVQSSGSSYSLAVNQDHNMQNASYSIPAIGYAIASPGAWNEGTTKGLGFTVINSTATSPSASWGSGNSYAALPNTATSFYTSTGLQNNTKDVIGMRLRADVTSTQPSGNYTNQMIITGTANP